MKGPNTGEQGYLHAPAVSLLPKIGEFIGEGLQAWEDEIMKAYLSLKSESEVAQSCPTLCDPVDCSLPGFSVHGILLARILEWVTISFSRGIFPTQGSDPGIRPLSPALQADTLTSEPPGKPQLALLKMDLPDLAGCLCQYISLSKEYFFIHF